MSDLVGLSEALGLVFVTENVISVFEDFVHLFSIELDEEAGREVVT